MAYVQTKWAANFVSAKHTNRAAIDAADWPTDATANRATYSKAIHFAYQSTDDATDTATFRSTYLSANNAARWSTIETANSSAIWATYCTA